MALAFPADTRLSGIISCAICLESKQGRNPKGLHCFHSFCRPCLQGWQDRFHNKKEINCPVCRRQTKLPQNGIDGLADDFKVGELIDLMKSIGDPFVCQGCVSRGTESRAKVKCITCDLRLCDGCYEFHRTSDMFDNHEVVTELCELHGNKVTHICVTCFLGLCVGCIFSRIHEKHDTCKLVEGLQRMKKCTEQDCKTYVDLCKSRIRQIEREKERKEDNARRQISIVKGIWAVIKQETEAQMSTIEEKYISKQKAEVKSWFDAEKKKKYPPVSVINDECEISKLALIRTEVRQNLQLLRHTDIKPPSTSMNQNIDHSYFAEIGLIWNLNSKMCDKYKKAVQKIKGKPVQIWRKNTRHITGLEVLEDCSAIVAYDNHDHVVRFDTNGKVMGVYHLAGQGKENKVRCITTHDGNLHILCEDNQSLVTITTDTYKRHNRRIHNLIGRIHSLGYDPVGACFLFRAEHGKMLKCMKDETSATPCSLSDGSVRVVKHQGDYKTMVVRYFEGEVVMYGMHWMRLSTFKECNKSGRGLHPRDVSMLDHEILLIADNNNHRISMFNLSDGSFVGHLLSREDGISHPWYIACKYPYLWVASSGTLQLFKLV